MLHTFQTNSFSIRDIENLSGIKAHTLRIWEQRYQFSCPKRRSGNHRYYDNEELKYILRVACLYHNGYKISKIIQLSEKEICEQTIRISTQTGFDNIFINQLTEASMDFDQESFDKILDNAILHLGFEKCITAVVFPFLCKVGLLWLTGHIFPAHEHFASALIIKKMQVAIHGLPRAPAKNNKTVIVYSPKGEYHEIPLLFMWYNLKKNKVNTIYFGRNTDLPELEYYCSHKPATHLYFHLITNSLYNIEGYLEKVSRLFSDKEIVVSGQKVQTVTRRFANISILKTEEEIFEFARS
jgi:DNA-binding transcriptional MerR regulator